ncbi:PH domain-containing protein [Halosimplex aquaticum]|uniref:PH domain-containing protein n=1 Tax=Halosimplex aquaticum TaxID=3026162 RepID=A0ABD5Y199_9EURY|nr:PH domain-containing protein [Halosimplex aquaticum]
MTAEHEWLSLDPGEEVVWTGQPRVWRIAGTVAGGVVITLLAFGGAIAASMGFLPGIGGLTGSSSALVWGIAVLVALSQVGSVTLAYLRVEHTDYVLTDRRIYRKTGIFSETVTSVGVDRVQNTTLHKDITGNFFDYGTVSLSTAGSGGADLSVSDLDDPETFRDRLQEQVRAAGEAREDDPAPSAETAALDGEAMDALLTEARRLRAVAERMEENV